MITCSDIKASFVEANITRNSSGDEIVNMNFLYDCTRTTKYNMLVHKFCHRSTRLSVRTQV